VFSPKIQSFLLKEARWCSWIRRKVKRKKKMKLRIYINIKHCQPSCHSPSPSPTTLQKKIILTNLHSHLLLNENNSSLIISIRIQFHSNQVKLLLSQKSQSDKLKLHFKVEAKWLTINSNVPQQTPKPIRKIRNRNYLSIPHWQFKSFIQ